MSFTIEYLNKEEGEKLAAEQDALFKNRIKAIEDTGAMSAEGVVRISDTEIRGMVDGKD